jgi:hypothetical protein
LPKILSQFGENFATYFKFCKKKHVQFLFLWQTAKHLKFQNGPILSHISKKIFWQQYIGITSTQRFWPTRRYSFNQRWCRWKNIFFKFFWFSK